VKRPPLPKICALCGARSDLDLLIETTESERRRLGGATHLFISLCANCAAVPGVTDRIGRLLNLTLEGRRCVIAQ
jgi:hypothetical protein